MFLFSLLLKNGCLENLTKKKLKKTARRIYFLKNKNVLTCQNLEFPIQQGTFFLLFLGTNGKFRSATRIISLSTNTYIIIDPWSQKHKVKPGFYLLRSNAKERILFRRQNGLGASTRSEASTSAGILIFPFSCNCSRPCMNIFSCKRNMKLEQKMFLSFFINQLKHSFLVRSWSHQTGG